jgi:UDP-arabinose 4-epimerase
MAFNQTWIDNKEMKSESILKESRPVVLVTGGAGYIGSHACKALSKAGYLPVTYDNLERGHAELVKWGPLEKGDLNETSQLFEVVEQYQPVGVMHFAALAYVGESVEKPGLYYRNNVEGSASLLKAMEGMENPLIIFSSTCATYGEPEQVPIPESHTQRPVNPYGETKLKVEQLLSARAAASKLRYINLRYFNAAGADPDGETGELHDPETHLIPLALQAAEGHLEKLQIFGDDYPTPDGTCIRDYIHVTDLVDAHVLALEHLIEGGKSDSFNLANGNGFSVKEVIEAVEKVTGNLVPTETVARRPGDPPKLIGDASRVRDQLNWKPLFHNLEDMVKSAWTFHL